MRKLPHTFSECCRLCAFSLSHNNFFAAWALLPPRSWSSAWSARPGLAAWADGSISWCHRAEHRWQPRRESCCSALSPRVRSLSTAGCAAFCVTDLFPGRGTARAASDVLYALLVSFAFGRAMRELEAQLEYERVRREKLESQLDDYRAEISQLREGWGKTYTTSAASSVSATPAPLAAAQRATACCLCMFVPSTRGQCQAILEKMCYSFHLGALSEQEPLSVLARVSAVKGYQFLSLWQRRTAILHLNVHQRSGLIPSTSTLHI